MNTQWEIRFTRDGVRHSVIKHWPELPSIEVASKLILCDVLPKNAVVSEAVKADYDKLTALLKHYEVEVTAVLTAS